MHFLSYLLRKKYPVHRQSEINDCAPAALLSVLRYYKGGINPFHLRRLCRTGPSGTTLLDLKQAAERIGFRAVGATGNFRQLRDQQVPFIAHIIDDQKTHYVVVYKIFFYCVLIGDPAEGLKIISRSRFEIMWKSRIVLLLWPTDIIKNREDFNPGKYLKSVLDHQRPIIIQGIFLGIINTFSGIFIAFYIRYIIDVIIPSSNLERLKLAAVVLVILFLLSAVSILIRQRILVLFVYRAGNAINFRFQKHLYRLQKYYFDSTYIGDTMVRLNDVMKIPAAIVVIFGTIIIDFMLVLFVTGSLFLVNGGLALVVVCSIPVNLSLVLLLMRKISRDQIKIVQTNSALQDRYIDTLEGIDDIISFNAQKMFIIEGIQAFKKLQDKIKSFGLHQTSLNFTTDIFRAGLTIFILLAGASLVIQSQLMIGQVIAGYYLVSHVMPALSRLGETSVTLKAASIAWNRLTEIWQIPSENLKTGISFHSFEGLLIKDGSFSWRPPEMLWQDVNMEIKRGAIAALTGPNGSGKSTLLQVLQRKYELLSGELLLDGRPVEKTRLRDYRRHITLVPQMVHIFKSTLKDNILLGRPEWYLNALLTRFLLGGWILRFGKGLQTELGDGNRPLSGGERQFIGLLRALYAQPDVLLIDESLNAVDHDIRSQIINTLRLFTLEGSVLICSHDKNLLRLAGVVYVLDNGRLHRYDPLSLNNMHINEEIINA